MNFSSPQLVEEVVWTLRLADFPRAQNRARINNLANGWPPYDEAEVAANQIAVNYNDLSLSNIAHNARRQLANAFLAPDPLFTVELDSGPVWQRRGWSATIQNELNRIIKGSLPYLECRRSVFAQLVLHGIGPSSWPDAYTWCPEADGVEDILVPSNTLLSLRNLPFLARYRQYSARELWEMTHRPQVDPGWNVPKAEKCVKWVNDQTRALSSASYLPIWSPEKMSERIKQDSGYYSSDCVPTIDCFEFLYWNDEGKKSGWRKKIVLDAWGEPGVGGAGGLNVKPSKQPGKYGQWNYDASDFLYDSEERRNPVFCDKLSQTVHFQFADCSCVAPFRYHSVRSLGFLLYSICHVQNRLNCKFDESTFEQLMQYFRVSNSTDSERAWKVDLTDKKALPDGLQFVKRDERWEVDGQLVQMALQKNRQIMSDNSASFTQDFDQEAGENETATRTMAKVNTSAALVPACSIRPTTTRNSSMTKSAAVSARRTAATLTCASSGWRSSRPVSRRKCSNSTLERAAGARHGRRQQNAAKRHLRQNHAAVLQQAGPDRAAQHASARPGVAHGRLRTRAPGRARTSRLSAIPFTTRNSPRASCSRACRSRSKEAVNHSEYVEALLATMMAAKVQQIAQRGGVGTPDEIMGLQNLAGETIEGQPIPGNGITAHIKLFAEDEKPMHVKGVPADHSVKEKVKKYSDALAQLMNAVKGFQQRMQEQAQKQNGKGGGLDPATAAKIQGSLMMAKVKAQNMRESHAQRTAERQVQFEQQFAQKADEHKQELEHNRLKEFFGGGN